MGLLRIFLAVLLFATAASAETEVEYAGDWIINTTTDPFTDKKDVFSFVFSDNKDDNSALSLDCSNDKINLLIQNIDLEPFDSAMVGMRIRKGELTFLQWDDILALSWLRHPSPKDIVATILESNAERLVLQLERSGFNVTSVFSLNGFDVVYERTAVVCQE